MSAGKLKEALNDCLINFDGRVLLTDLINDYQMPIDEVSRTLMDYLKQQEKEGVKYEKRYVVHGMEAEEPNNEVFQIVKGESKLNEWLKKLKNAESSLYSVEVEGGAKPPADDLKPVTWCAIQLEDLQTRKKGAKPINGNADKSLDVKVEKKTETKPTRDVGSSAKTKSSESTSNATTDKCKKKEFADTSAKSSTNDNKKISPESNKKSSDVDAENKSPQKSAEQKKKSPKNKKAAAVVSGQKGIGNFFAPKGKETTDSTNKSPAGAVGQKSPKKLNDFFKKQVAKPATPKEALKKEEDKANASAQLFADDESEEEEEMVSKKKIAKKEKQVEVVVESSDEEEELNKLRRKVEDADKKEEAAASSRKRLRIEDSDDEDDEQYEEPQQKHGKLEEPVAVEESPPKSETFLDEDGFVITVKSKKPQTKPAKPASTRQKTPTKISPKEKKAKQTPTPASKSKQGNIMNFFKKK